MRPPFNLEAVEASTVAGLEAGHRVFHTHRFAEDDQGQVALLLEEMDPPEGAIVLDAGCGIGEVSRLMSEIRPDLSFVLVNVSPFQMSLCPVGEQYLPVLEDCHDLDIADENVDAVMFSSALCQMDTAVALAEAARVLRAGGVLLINDMARTFDDDGSMENILAARVLKEPQLVELIEAAGFTIDSVTAPEYSDKTFRELLAADGLEHLIDGVYPIIIRATKGRAE